MVSSPGSGKVLHAADKFSPATSCCQALLLEGWVVGGVAGRSRTGHFYIRFARKFGRAVEAKSNFARNFDRSNMDVDMNN